MLILLRLLRTTHYRHALLLLLGAVTVVLVGGKVFAATQHLPVTTGWYWAVTTATTVGYGDVTPKNPSGRIVASVVMLTAIPMVGAAFALATGSAISNRLRRLLVTQEHGLRDGFRLVVGMHASTPTILDELLRSGNAVVLVADVDPSTLPDAVRLVRGDPASAAVLRRAQPARAADALVGGASDGDVLVSSVLLHEQAPDLVITAVVSAPAVAEALREIGVTNVLSADQLVAHTVAKVLEAPHAGDLLLQLLSSEGNRLVERPVGAELAGRALSAVRDARDDLVLGVVQRGALSLGIGDDPVVGAGDLLLVVEPARQPSAEPSARAVPRRQETDSSLR